MNELYVYMAMGLASIFGWRTGLVFIAAVFAASIVFPEYYIHVTTVWFTVMIHLLAPMLENSYHVLQMLKVDLVKTMGNWTEFKMQ